MLTELLISISAPSVQSTGPAAAGKNESAICIHNLHTSSLLNTLRGHNFPISTHSLATVFSQGQLSHLLAAAQDRMLISSWRINKEQSDIKLQTPAIITALTASKGGEFLVGGTADGRILLWELSSGSLLKIIDGGHYGKVSAVKWVDDSTAFVSAGEDGNSCVWSLAQLFMDGAHSKPMTVWKEHSLPVVDLHVGPGSMLNARVVSCSSDRSVKLYHLGSQKCLATILLPCAPSCLTMDLTETCIYVGSSDFKIYRIPLYNVATHSGTSLNRPTQSLKSIRTSGVMDVDVKQALVGHSHSITSITLNIDASVLVSGDASGTILVFDLSSNACVKRFSGVHNGPITNILTVLKPNGFGENKKEKDSNVIAKQLKRTVWNVADDFEPVLSIHGDLSPVTSHHQHASSTTDVQALQNEIATLKEQNAQLVRVGEQMYQVAIGKVLEKS